MKFTKLLSQVIVEASKMDFLLNRYGKNAPKGPKFNEKLLKNNGALRSLDLAHSHYPLNKNNGVEDICLPSLRSSFGTVFRLYSKSDNCSRNTVLA